MSANGYTPTDRKSPNLSLISGIVTEKEIALVGMTAGGARHLRIAVRVSGVTVVGSISLKLQQAVTGSDTFVDLVGANATVAVTADGVVNMTQVVERAADQPNMPLNKTVRVVVTTTNAGDELTVDNVYILMPL